MTLNLVFCIMQRNNLLNIRDDRLQAKTGFVLNICDDRLQAKTGFVALKNYSTLITQIRFEKYPLDIRICFFQF